ncbi:hypothetical protein OHA27_01025 [Streptomyces sp. NBC_01619]|uniref:Uncharacterized protein n=1 Tax=Streptomyces pratisoli TaxID=3139917 RepID=A0ACC6QG54_9ACTN|nr:MULTISPECIES: hypothetical protein [unclassified Streptomyces]MCX4508903.1 hypothetical protein [Streptomyces sp. NBC_01619]
MARMQRGLVHAFAWSLATGAAVTLSWWGVHTVMEGTVYDRPRALPITTDARNTQGSTPQSSSTRFPGSTSASPASPEDTPDGSSQKSSAPPPSEPPSGGPSKSKRPSTPSASGNVKSYSVEGGRVAYDIGPSSAELVSATPAGGWTMQIWKQPTYIRVTFSQNGREIDVFCTWHDTAPRVEIEER